MLTTYVLLFLIGTLLSWVSLLVVVPIAQKIAEFSFPPWDESAWKLLIVASATSLVSTAVGAFSTYLSWLVGAAVFWILMVKWFDVDMFGAVAIAFVTRMFNVALLLAAAGLLAGMHLT